MTESSSSPEQQLDPLAVEKAPPSTASFKNPSASTAINNIVKLYPNKKERVLTNHILEQAVSPVSSENTIPSAENEPYPEPGIENETSKYQFSEVAGFLPIENPKTDQASVLLDVINPEVTGLKVDNLSKRESGEQLMTDSYSKKETDLMMENLSLRMDGRFASLETLIQNGFKDSQMNTERQLQSLEKRFDEVKSQFDKVDSGFALLQKDFKHIDRLVIALILPLVISLVAAFVPMAYDLWKNTFFHKTNAEQIITSPVKIPAVTNPSPTPATTLQTATDPAPSAH